MYFLADNIISPLGNTTELNYQAVAAGRSALRHYPAADAAVPGGCPAGAFPEESVSSESYVAARFSAGQLHDIEINGLTRFEALAAQSARQAIDQAGIDVSAPNVVFILSTTKANIDNLRTGEESDEAFIPSAAAEHIATYLGFTTKPLVVCNACISGVAAIITAKRLLDAGFFDQAVVCGADVLGRFFLSGFQSLKALSPDECRPFDIERIGLNLGEAAATIVFSTSRSRFRVEDGAIRNDAFHISSPSKNGEGAYLALQAIQAATFHDDLSFINAHGTATMFNDQMEAVAISRAGLSDVPVNGLKGFFGHTMGAAGILETIMSKEALLHGQILATRGFEETGTSVTLNLANVNRAVSKKRFIKMISGFGGGNAAVLVHSEDRDCISSAKIDHNECVINTHHHIILDSRSVKLDQEPIACNECGRNLLVELYKKYISDYPKFYKMDPLCRLGLVASDLLLQAESDKPQAVILFNHSSSSQADRSFWATVSDPDESFPSPAHFVYTLPNIVTGEIAMRHGIHGETSFYILPDRDEGFIKKIVNSICREKDFVNALVGWIDYPDDEHYLADLRFIRKA